MHRCIGDVVWTGSTGGMLTDACRFAATYRIVRIRKIKRVVPSPSKRLAAWVGRKNGRTTKVLDRGCGVGIDASKRFYAVAHQAGFEKGNALGVTEIEAKRALVKKMGRQVDE